MKITNSGISFKDSWQRNTHVIYIYIFLVLMILVSGILDRDFLSLRNFNNLILSVLPILFVSSAQMLILLMSDIDLSLGSIISLCNVIAVTLMRPESPTGYILAITVAMVVGILCGLINGLLVTKLRLPSVIVTIATSSVYGGLALFIHPIPGGKVHNLCSKFIMGRLWFPTPIILMIVFILAVYFLSSRATFGMKLRAVGGNSFAAFTTGISIVKIKIITYCLAGFIAGLSAIFLTAQMRCGDATVGNSFTVNSLTVAVVGGTALSGTVGGVSGVVAGSFIIMIINNILNLINISSFYQYVMQGVILIFALAISSRKSKREGV